MGLENADRWLSDVTKELDCFYKKVDDKIEKELQSLRASQKKTELEIKLAQEMKLHNELTEQLSELMQRGDKLDRVCAMFQSNLTIAESDKNRLNNAKETYILAKELTGIRWDFEAPPNVAKGYIKSERYKQLRPFEFRATEAEEKLWLMLKSLANDENTPPNQM